VLRIFPQFCAFFCAFFWFSKIVHLSAFLRIFGGFGGIFFFAFALNKCPPGKKIVRTQKMAKAQKEKKNKIFKGGQNTKV
jgi:hypothetical protein